MLTMQAKNCPFCNHEIDLTDPDVLYPSGTGWIPFRGYRSYVHISDIRVPKENWCYKIVCQETSGGCGAEIHADSKEEVIAKWNKRVKE